MNHSQIDHLLQVTVPRSEPLGGISRGRASGPPFDDHFRAANEPVPEATPSSSFKPAATPTASQNTSTASASSLSPSPSDTDRQSRAEQEDDADQGNKANETTVEAVAADAQEVAPSDALREEDDTETEANAEVVALLTAEQAVQAKVVEQVEHAADDSEAGPSDTRAANVDAVSKSGATIETTATADVPVEAESADPESNDLPDEAQSNRKQAVRQSESAGIEQASAESEAVVEVTSAENSGGEARPASSKDRPHDRGPDERVANSRAVEHSSGGAQVKPELATTAAAAGKVAEAVERQETPSKVEKKSSARTGANSNSANSTPAERPANVARIPEPAAGNVPVAANVQVPSSQDAATSAPSSNSKSLAGPKDAKPGVLSSLARLDRGATHGTRSQRPGQAESTPHVDPARFVSRVVRAVQTAHERGGPLQLRLSPPELGALRIELSVERGTLAAKIETDNASAKQVLLDNLPSLRDRLADQNVKIERFDVDVRRDPSGDQQRYAPQDRDQQQRQANGAGNQANSRRPIVEAAIEKPAPVHRTISTTSINVVA